MEGIREQNTVSKPMEFKNLKKYLKKEDAVCKLITGNGTGFFCKFEINGIPMKALFTNNHVLEENSIEENSKIQLRHNDKTKQIIITPNRFKCTNTKLDYTCIQIFDNENYNNFFEIDDNINCQNPDEEYGNKKGVILQFPNERGLSCADGNIEGFENDNKNNNNQIIHRIATDVGSSGSPIVLSDNLKVIGIHNGRIDRDTNRGVYFRNILSDIENK